MKKIYYLMLSLLIVTFACSDDDKEDYKTATMAVQLSYPAESGYEATEGVIVTMASKSGVVYAKETNASGLATFSLPVGLYEVSATDRRSETGKSVLFSGMLSNVNVLEVNESPVELSLVKQEVSQLVIKELYIGGCQKDDGSGAFFYDRYVILYNNSDENVELQNLCLGMVLPYNSNATNNDYQNGVLFYEAEGWIPAGQGFFYFKNEKTLAPGEQVVVAFNNANDNTLTYSNSVDLSSSEYYVTYEPEVYTNSNYHPSPSQNIPSEHYLPGFKYGAGNAWTLSNVSPAFFIFAPEGISPVEFNADVDNENAYNGNATQLRKKVPAEWVIDGIEVYKYGATNNTKRLTPTVDAGYIDFKNYQG